MMFLEIVPKVFRTSDFKSEKKTIEKSTASRKKASKAVYTAAASRAHPCYGCRSLWFPPSSDRLAPRQTRRKTKTANACAASTRRPGSKQRRARRQGLSAHSYVLARPMIKTNRGYRLRFNKPFYVPYFENEATSIQYGLKTLSKSFEELLALDINDWHSIQPVWTSEY